MSQMLPRDYRQREHAVCEQAAPGARWTRPSSEPLLFHADRFLMALPKDWTNNTTYVLDGPVADNHQHTIQINVNPNAEDVPLVNYADRQIKQQTASDGRLLTRGLMELNSGKRAYRALLCSTSPNDRLVYQDQLYVVHSNTRYKLSASFTENTITTIGPVVNAAFQCFTPHAPLRMRHSLP